MCNQQASGIWSIESKMCVCVGGGGGGYFVVAKKLINVFSLVE